MKTDLTISAEENQIIVESLVHLPSEALRKQAKTEDQVKYMLACQFQISLAALCFDSLRGYEADDPIRPLLKSGQISKYTYNRAWLTAHFFCTLWQLIQSSFSFIQPELRRLGFGHVCTSAVEVFNFFARYMVDDDCATCLAKYCEISSRKVVKRYRRAKKLFNQEGTVVQQRHQSKKSCKDELDITLTAILTICCIKARNEPVIKGRLEALIADATRLGDYVAKQLYNAPCHAWKNGKLGKGDKRGIYKFS